MPREKQSKKSLLFLEIPNRSNEDDKCYDSDPEH